MRLKYAISIAFVFVHVTGFCQDSKIFWVDQTANKIQSASLDGSNVTDVLTGLNLPECVAIDTSSEPMKLYFTESGNPRVARCNLDGSDPEDIVTGIDSPEDLELDLVNRKVFWLTDIYSTDKVQCADMDGLNSNIETIYTNNYAAHRFSGIAVEPDSQWVFWTQSVYGGLDRLNRINYDGSGRTILGNYLSPRDVEISGNKIYWCWPDIHAIMSADLEGQGVDTLLTDMNGDFFAIDTTLGSVFWTENGKVRSANLDNTGHTDLVTGLSYTLKGIAIYYNPLSSIPDAEAKNQQGFFLARNYPNPFNPITNIEFSIPNSEFVTLKIYNLMGQEVEELVAKRLTPGGYKYTWDAGALASGVYLYRLQAGRFVETRKMVMLR